MDNKVLGVFVPTQEEKEVIFKDYISRIYAILVRYESVQKIDSDAIKLLCFEIQSYSHLIGDNELGFVTGKLATLDAEGVDHNYVRKIVLDTTNFLSRLLK